MTHARQVAAARRTLVRLCDKKGHRMGTWAARCASATAAAGGLYRAARRLRELLVATDSSSSIEASRAHTVWRSQLTVCRVG
jgi:hypothetical protein